MPRKALLSISPHHVYLTDEDWEYLDTRFGPNGVQPIGISTIIRAIVHKQVLAWRNAENEPISQPTGELEDVGI